MDRTRINRHRAPRAANRSKRESCDHRGQGQWPCSAEATHGGATSRAGRARSSGFDLGLLVDRVAWLVGCLRSVLGEPELLAICSTDFTYLVCILPYDNKKANSRVDKSA